MIGDSIVGALASLKSKNINVEYKESEKGYQYLIKDKKYILEIIINAPTWIGLEFSLLNSKEKINLSYEINSDLYDLSLSKYAASSTFHVDEGRHL